MDLSNMLVDAADGGRPAGPAIGTGTPQHAGRTSSAAGSGIGAHNTSPHSASGHEHRRLPSVSQLDLPASPGGPGLAQLHKKSLSPTNSEEGPKEVTFVHITEDGLRGRIPFRVNITPSDSVDDIISTVKNFFGIYNNGSISFEDAQGKMFIPRYENFTVGGTAFVRGLSFPAADPDAFTPRGSTVGSPVKHPFQMPPPASNQPLKPAFGAMSPPPTFQRRSNSVGRSKGGTPTPFQCQGPSVKVEDGADDSDAASAKSSRRGVPSADVSLDNIVEGSRRKRAKFDSSELPLFVPPSVPAQGSLSSISPQRNGDRSSIAFSNQRTFAYTNPLPSPGGFANAHSMLGGYPHPSGRGRHILPTPDHTTGSAMSDEDVAYQLMRLGDPSNFSNQGRTSTSTINDAWSSHVAEGSSVDENYSEVEDDEDELPAGPLPDGDSGEEYEDMRDGSFKGESDDIMGNYTARRKSSNKGTPSRKLLGPVKPNKVSKGDKNRPALTKPKTKTTPIGKPLPSPTSLPTQSRKQSIASGSGLPPLGPDEQDLSSRPRCQRCRKSKKGCDRQRPCGRCRDAGLGIDDCISEDEGNGRKGRFGRYMGVPVKKDAGVMSAQIPIAYAVPAPPLNGIHPTIEDHADYIHSGGETGKKRKR